ncbi:hypothetical protein P0D88_34850 [Paraburkholderia sp. RL18-103-BIB-C]|uniref:hypothetical protein n=1 Tax=Paraburkholderia sp. RL18-103-BIB-C TaxID=3031637 RepID=UPI0038B8BC5D
MNNEQRKARQRDAFGARTDGTVTIVEPTLDSLEPNYDDRCEVCDASPTVEGWRHGRAVVKWHLCGPCCLGSARMLDPREWNE